jgi:hypothetical protein
MNAANKFFDELAKYAAPAFFQMASGALQGMFTAPRNFTASMSNFGDELQLAGITEEMLSRWGDNEVEGAADDGTETTRMAGGNNRASIHMDDVEFSSAVYRALDAAVVEVRVE